ncbi:ferric-chelate reductase (Fre2) [Cordyceps fumosorosea ARSEF 2679]|uniref:Ferric-chelate reductase (Fre2) n=1 Tax=Cordyceps fumosorosea (strain ARSEF 2679) TaxID=1081104 RepID=A0A167SBT1_CORFA|nr:ferric-chelate reductase (Fre2) [Cordyceps fumosorosea ARSEF 2679]OAA59462.1 ferric-chelate reductase (Fre2) [Cordyceps fumosorosea ARSEF 2679]
MVAFNPGCWLLVAAAVPAVRGDGVGIIGVGKTMYQPWCAYACRSVIGGSTLLCTPAHEPSAPAGGGHAPPRTPESCYAGDAAFLQTLALCIDTYCPGSDAPRVGALEEYWGGHAAAGMLADFSWVPAMTYQEALRRARLDEQSSAKNRSTTTTPASGIHEHHGVHARHGHVEEEEPDTTPVNTTLPVVKPGAPLNVTSFIRMSDWLKNYNGHKTFELNEAGHSKYTIVITVVPFVLAIVASLPRFLTPLTRSPSWAWINAMLVYPPLFGSRHRQPVGARVLGGGYVPSRGQSLYIAIIVALNAVLLVVPYTRLQPQSTFATTREQEISTIGCRAGLMAMGNAVVLVVFAGRNNPLLALTGWNYDTYLLLHRVFGYLAILHTVVHSVLLLVYYTVFGGYETEVKKAYWIWGVVATLAAVLLWPASVLAVRKRFYEAFLSVHHLLVVIFLVGYFYHIFYRYSFKWGYEIWCYVAGAAWGVERLVRLARMALMGRRTADVAFVPGSDGEYLRVDIDGAHAGGLVYLYFPTLSWRFWENHPFSVAASFSVRDVHSDSSSSTDAESAKEDKVMEEGKRPADIETIREARPPRKTVFAPVHDHRISILVRVQSGMTARLAARVSAAAGHRIRLPVVVEGPYHASSASELAQCTSIVCIAGGVGVSAVLPILRSHAGCRRRLFWGARGEGIVEECGRDVLDLPAAVRVEVSVGERLDIPAILREELLARTGERGPTGIVVCGPPGMADDVRNEVCRLARSGALARGVVLLDEAFTW